jgi:uncharacterized phage protein (TIGR02220 family)
MNGFSVYEYREAFKQKNIGPPRPVRHLLHTLSDHMRNSTGRCFVSTETLSEEMDCGQATVKRSRSAAIELNWIKATPAKTGGHSWRHYEYEAIYPPGVLSSLRKIKSLIKEGILIKKKMLESKGHVNEGGVYLIRTWYQNDPTLIHGSRRGIKMIPSWDQNEPLTSSLTKDLYIHKTVESDFGKEKRIESHFNSQSSEDQPTCQQEIKTCDLENDQKSMSEKQISMMVSKIIHRLNEKLFAKFNPNLKHKIIRQQILAGYTLEQFFTVIDRAVEDFKEDPENGKYANPKGIFNEEWMEIRLNSYPKKTTEYSRPPKKTLEEICGLPS